MVLTVLLVLPASVPASVANAAVKSAKINTSASTPNKVLATRFENMLNHNYLYGSDFESDRFMIEDSILALLDQSENGQISQDLVLGFTGLYHGQSISVMASGMGMPSISIYSHELFTSYGVENIVRIGTAGALQPDLNLKDIVVGMGACTNSAIPSLQEVSGFAPIADYSLLKAFCDTAARQNIPVRVGNLVSSDLFYGKDLRFVERWASVSALAVEMEAAALYLNAALLGKRALAVCTISDSLVTGESTTAKERQTSFSTMIELALDAAVSF